MRSGTNWVGTDWFPNSGQYANSGQSQVFYFSASRVANTRKVRINWWMTTECTDSGATPSYFLCYGTQKLVVNGQTVFTYSPNSGNNPYYINSSGKTVYYGFADAGSYLDKYQNGNEYLDRDGDYVGINRYILVLGSRWRTGGFEIEADSVGNVSFSVSGTFGWWGNNSLTFSKTFTVTGLIPVNSYTISFNSNTRDLVSGNNVYNMPYSMSKAYNVDVNLPSLKPHAGTKPNSKEANYTFYKWITNPASSFAYGPNSIGWTAGEVFRENASTSLNAIWQKVKKTVKFDLDGGVILGSPTGISDASVPYSDSFVPPASKKLVKSGYTFVGWRDTKGVFVPIGGSYTVLGNTTLTAQYTGNSYTIVLLDKDGNPLRKIPVRYGSVIQGAGCDFTYTLAGYECIGWSINHIPTLDIDSTAPRVANNFELPLNNLLYIGAGNYTNSPFVLPDGTSRVHGIYNASGSTIYLYPILKYATSFYVYTAQGWKLAMPYVYTTSNWKQSTGYIYQQNHWVK